MIRRWIYTNRAHLGHNAVSLIERVSLYQLGVHQAQSPSPKCPEMCREIPGHPAWLHQAQSPSPMFQEFPGGLTRIAFLWWWTILTSQWWPLKRGSTLRQYACDSTESYKQFSKGIFHEREDMVRHRKQYLVTVQFLTPTELLATLVQPCSRTYWVASRQEVFIMYQGKPIGLFQELCHQYNVFNV